MDAGGRGDSQLKKNLPSGWQSARLVGDDADMAGDGDGDGDAVWCGR
jgi:hypothetical protein